MIPCDLHIHPDYSIDSQTSIETYCERAERMGIKVLGFSTHYDINPARADVDPFMVVDGKKVPADNRALRSYVKHCLKIRDRYPRLGILTGLEVDYFPGVEEKISELKREFEFDYLIGSVHCIDNINLSSAAEAPGYYRAHSLDQLGDDYFNLLYCLADCGLFDIIGHADYYLRFCASHYGPGIFDIYKGRLERVVGAAIRTGTGFEINTSYKRHGGDSHFPRPDFVRAAADLGAVINSLGSDSHHQGHLGTGINEALAFLNSHDIEFKPVYEIKKTTSRIL